MDIFNRKRVEELEAEIKQLKRDNRELNGYKEALIKAERDIADLLSVKSQIPEDCVPGKYCNSCEFSKEYYFYYTVYPSHHYTRKEFICNRGSSCKNFIQKEVENG